MRSNIVPWEIIKWLLHFLSEIMHNKAIMKGRKKLCCAPSSLILAKLSSPHIRLNKTVTFAMLFPVFSLQFEYVRSAVMNEYLIVFMLSSILIGVLAGLTLFIYCDPFMTSK